MHRPGGYPRATASIFQAVDRAIREDVFLGAVVLAADPEGIVLYEAFGHACRTPEPIPMTRDTVFDLASLTKPLGTALAVAALVDSGKCAWDTPVLDVLGVPPSTHPHTAPVRIHHLLDHSSGLPFFRPYFMRFRGREGVACKPELRRMILGERPLAPPGRTARYGDLAYMLLEWVVESASGMTLDAWIEDRVYGPLNLTRTGFAPGGKPGFEPDRYAQTAYCPYRKRFLRGEVHDRNAFSVGGFSGHAGLFGPANEVYTLLDRLYRCYRGEQMDGFLNPKRVEEMFTWRSQAPHSTFRLGFDSPSPEGSSAGTHFSRNSVGHLGFTGTSFWMDLETGFIVVLLTNRLMSRPRNTRIRRFRPLLHDRIREAFP